ncbi:MAG TPA: hypothetical protein DEB25_03450 [Desulfobulbaceae bacterium]|nr:hypothetical protein [Desulfobulbaceae bacterium]
MQANFPFTAWPDISPPPAFLSLLAEVFPGVQCRVSLLPLVSDGPPSAVAPADFLRPDELRQWQSFASNKRKREWLGGRLCAYNCARWLIAARKKTSGNNYESVIARNETTKKSTTMPDTGVEKDHRFFRSVCNDVAVKECFSARDWWLAADENGRPFWQGNLPEALSGMDISLSHGGAYALAIIATRRVGADVEACRTKVQRVAAQFCHLAEEERLARLIPQQDRLARLTLLWSAKESLRKAATGLPGFLAMRLTDGSHIGDGWRLVLTWGATGRQSTVATTLHDGHAFAFCFLEE